MTIKLGTQSKNYLKLVFLLIVLLAGVLRFSFLGQNPPGLTNDEADIGYDAYSILKTGKDQWGELFPLSAFMGFGDYRPPVYTYLVVPSIALFGLNEFAVRFPSALIGLLTVILTFFLIKKLFNEKTALIVSFLLAISPWHIGMSRVGIESNVAVFLTVLAVYLFFLSFKNYKLLILSAIVIVLDLYAYYSMRMFVPVICLALFLLYKNNLPGARKIALLSLFLGSLLLMPIAKSFTESGGQGRLGQITFTKDVGLLNNINEKRGACQTKLPGIVCKIVYNKPVTYFSTFLANYINHFSPNLLFLSGSSTSLSVMPPRGFLYLFELPFLIIGIIYLAAKRTKENVFFLTWVFIAPLADSLTSSGHYSRMLALLPALQITTAVGFMLVYENIKKASFPLTKILMSVFIMLSLVSLGAFITDYSTYYPTFFSRSSHYGYKELFQYLKTNENNYSEIFISNKYYDTKQYIFYLFFTKYDPARYQTAETKNAEREKDGWVRISRVDNYFFVNTIPGAKDLKKTSLIIGDPKEFPQKIRTQKVFYDLKGDPTFSLILGSDLLLFKAESVGYEK